MLFVEGKQLLKLIALRRQAGHLVLAAKLAAGIHPFVEQTGARLYNLQRLEDAARIHAEMLVVMVFCTDCLLQHSGEPRHIGGTLFKLDEPLMMSGG